MALTVFLLLELRAGTLRRAPPDRVSTDDLSPMLGESPEVDGLYLACGLNSVGILSGGGLGHMMAQWLIEEHPPLDVTAVGVDRAHEFQAT